MAMCTCPGCTRNDETDELFFEKIGYDGTWVPVCRKHRDISNPNVRLTDEVKNLDVDVLDQIVDDLVIE